MLCKSNECNIYFSFEFFRYEGEIENIQTFIGVNGIFTYVYYSTLHTSMLKIKRDINQQDLNIVDLHFVKSE